tara:strand:+ start:465 stop:752 length:288 start_codon:yes stop_codon:yes gene_type:complete
MKPIGSKIFKCVSCGFQEKGPDLVETEKLKEPLIVEEGVVEDKNIFADYPFVCEKCGFDKAEIVERQPYVSDEDSLTYLKCGKCSWMENLARKTS